MAKDFMPLTFPYVPGMDGAGVVVGIGDAVTTWRNGEAVLGMFETGTLAYHTGLRTPL